MNDTASALLAAHIEHELGRLSGPALGELVRERVEAAFAWLEGVTMNDVVTREQIVGVIERYAIQLKVSGGITELAGEMANVVFSSRASTATRVRDVCDPKDYADFADKIVGLEGVQRELVKYLVRSSAFGTLASRVLSRMVLDLFLRSDAGTASRLREILSRTLDRAVPGFERRAGAALSRYVERHASRITREGEQHLLEALDPEWVRQLADEVWDAISVRPLSEAGSFFTPQDLEDFVVLGYEFWLKFRKTPYFHAITRDVVDRLFEKYGDESLSSVIADMGVTQPMITHELATFLGPLFEHARRTGFLERELRAYLEPFYDSPAVLAILSR